MTFGRTWAQAPGAGSAAAPRAPAGQGPAHYRLSKATWDIILDEYVQGATARELSDKWRVSGHAVRKRITQHGATKREHGDREAMAQAHERARALRQEQDETPEARARRLFDPDPDEGEEMGDPAALARLATLASGRAMKGRLWTEAKALAGLAESYGRVGERSGAGPGAKTGGYGLADLLRMMLDDGFVNDVMFLAYESEDPDVARLREQMEPQREANGRGMAALRSRGYAEGRSDLRQELGLAAEEGLPDAWVWSNGVMMRHSVLEQLRKEWTLVPMPVEGAEDEGD